MTKVLVTGVFDILHQEHKKLLKKAKKQGDYLVVALETDERVKKIKGSSRPVNSLKTRIQNLKDLNIANKVTPLPKKFNTNKERLSWLKKIKPDVLAVSESTPNIKVKRQLMNKIGGKVKVVLPHNPNISTTKIIKQMLDKESYHS